MSTGFSFGAKTTAAPTFGTGSITFGTPAASSIQQPQFGFGSLASSTPSLFGTPTSTTSTIGGFKPAGFGTPTSAPAFGAAATSTPGSGFSFGGGLSAQPANQSFGASNTGTPSGLSFGTPASATPFGTAPSTSASGGLGFGTASAPGLGFGTAANTAAATTATTGFGGLSFGAPASTGLSFGGLGTAATSTAAPTLGGFGVSTAGQSSGLSFGLGTATSSAPSLSFGLGGGTSTAPLVLGGFGTAATSAGGLSSFGGLGGVSTAPSFSLSTPSTQVGLGGISMTTQSKPGTATAQKEVPPKEQALPNEFKQTIDQFKTWVQDEKTRSSEVSQVDVKEFHKIESDLDQLNQQFHLMESSVQNNRNLAEKLKFTTAKELQNLEMVQRIHDAPPNLHYEDNPAPLRYFLELTDGFEKEMQQLKVKIDNTEKFIKKCKNPSVITSHDLSEGMKHLHETFVALAGRMQTVHNRVESQKEAYVNLKRQATKDTTNPFEGISRNAEALNIIMQSTHKIVPPALACGPTPFNSIALGSNNMSLIQNNIAQQQQQVPTTSAPTLGLGLGFNSGNTSTFGAGSLFGSTSNSSTATGGFGAVGTQPFQLGTSGGGFQLQKPPTGNKRGKQ